MEGALVGKRWSVRCGEMGVFVCLETREGKGMLCVTRLVGRMSGCKMFYRVEREGRMKGVGVTEGLGWDGMER